MNGILSSKMIGKGMKLVLDDKTGKHMLEANPDLTSIGYNDRGELVVLQGDHTSEDGVDLELVLEGANVTAIERRTESGQKVLFVEYGLLYNPTTGSWDHNRYSKVGVTEAEFRKARTIAEGRRVQVEGQLVNLSATTGPDVSLTTRDVASGNWTVSAVSTSVQYPSFPSWRVVDDVNAYDGPGMHAAVFAAYHGSVEDDRVRRVIIHDSSDDSYHFMQHDHVYSDQIKMTNGHVNVELVVDASGGTKARVVSFEHAGSVATTGDQLDGWGEHLRAMRQGLSVAPEIFENSRFKFVDEQGNLVPFATINFDFYS